LRRCCFDTVAPTAGTREKNTLADLAERELVKFLDKKHQAADWSGTLSPEMLDYAAHDAETTRDLYTPLAAKIKAAKLERIAIIESRAVPAFVWLTASGTPFDADAWASLATESEEHERSLIERLAPCSTVAQAQALRNRWPKPSRAEIEPAPLESMGSRFESVHCSAWLRSASVN
jgi:ribonuclease D